MDSIGLDVHKNETQICILTEDGEIIEDRILTRRDRFDAVLGERAKSKVVLEASTESEWVAQCLEAQGHEVIVGDPRYELMYASRSRAVKTDRRDAQALATACRLGTYRAVHRVSADQRMMRAQLAVRETLVRSRSRCISVIRSLLRQEGIRVGSGSSSEFVKRVEALDLPDRLRLLIKPLMTMLGSLDVEIQTADRLLVLHAGRDPVTDRLQTVPGVGPVTSVAFRSALDEVARFHGAHQVESYLGLVPREHSSGEKQHRGRITKAGNSRVRYLLVEAAWSLMRTKQERARHLREWAERIAQRRGRSVAAVALARKLAGILFAMWRDGTDFRVPHPHASTGAVSKAA